jgi:hypothetical protein
VPALANVTATGIYCGYSHVAVTYTSEPLTPLLTRLVGPAQVSLAWHSAPVVQPWHVLYRLDATGATFAPEINLPPSARSYVLAGLIPGRLYQVELTNTEWGSRSVWITPAHA